MKDLKNNKKRHHKTHQRRPGCVLAVRLEPTGRGAPTGLAIKGKMAPSPACHLVAFPEPVAAALFRPALNVPPAPRGPRSWSALTRRPGRGRHPRGPRPGSPQAPTPRSLRGSLCPASSPLVPDPAQLPPSWGSRLCEPARVGGGGCDSLNTRVLKAEGLRMQPTQLPGDPKPKGFAPRPPPAL